MGDTLAVVIDFGSDCRMMMISSKRLHMDSPPTISRRHSHDVSLRLTRAVQQTSNWVHRRLLADKRVKVNTVSKPTR